MSQVLVLRGKSKVINNLDTYNYTVVEAGMHMVRASVSEIPPSGMSIVLQKNSVTQKTSEVPAATQQLVDTQIVMNCAVNDVISVVLSSSDIDDTGRNVLKGIINIHRGSV